MPAVRGMLRVNTMTQLAAVLPLTNAQREAARLLAERGSKPTEARTTSNGAVGAAIAGRKVSGGGDVTGGPA